MPGNPIKSFSHGFFAPFRAAIFLKGQPGLYKFIGIPLAINIIFLTTAAYFGLYLFEHTIIDLIPQGETWYWIILSYLLWLVAILLVLVLVFFSFTVIGNLIASPFNDLLSEKTEAIIQGGHNDEPFSLAIFFTDAGRIIRDESRKIFIFVILMLLLLPLNFITGIGTLLYTGLSLMLTIFFLVVEYTGYIITRKRLRFIDQRRYIFSHFVLMFGFGTGLLCLLAIPLVHFFCIPLGVISATILYLETTTTVSV